VGAGLAHLTGTLGPSLWSLRSTLCDTGLIVKPTWLERGSIERPLVRILVLAFRLSDSRFRIPGSHWPSPPAAPRTPSIGQAPLL